MDRQEMLLNRSAFQTGLKAGVPIALGYTGIGLALGVIAAAEGLNALEVFLMSLLVYAGSGQFAMVGLLAMGDSILSIGVTIFLINLRNFLMGLHVATIFKDSHLKEGLLAGSLLSDETYGLLLSQQLHGPVSIHWLLGNNFISYVSWVLSTVLGNLLGANIPAPESFGLDYALLAMFIGIFTTQLSSLRLAEPITKILKILLTVGGSFLLLALWLPKSVAVLLATLSGCVMGVYLDDK